MIWNHQQMSESKYGRTYLVIVHIVFGVGLAALLALVFGYFVMLLWNAVLPAAIGVHTLTYLQGVELLVLARILVGGLGSHGSSHGHAHGRRSKAWQEYEEWWREVGEGSFHNFSGSRSKEE